MIILRVRLFSKTNPPFWASKPQRLILRSADRASHLLWFTAIMFRNTICVFLALAPTLVSAAAFLSSGPRPTLIRPEPDAWSPAPTVGPQLDAIELLRRVITAESVTPDRTCGFVSGDACMYLLVHCHVEGEVLTRLSTTHNMPTSRLCMCDESRPRRSWMLRPQ
jgi:hypothetical protein